QPGLSLCMLPSAPPLPPRPHPDTHVPCSTAEKPGTCPSPWPGADRLCDVRCHSDWECPGPQKCCPYGCHVSCYDPI
uniref:WAP domain-containing protein n=1 Tax=Varanus komodoensis TaxID=61221 RepID=A0A8D2Q223_VARKO